MCSCALNDWKHQVRHRGGWVTFYAIVLSALISGQDESRLTMFGTFFPASYSPICYICPSCYMLIDVLLVWRETSFSAHYSTHYQHLASFKSFHWLTNCLLPCTIITISSINCTSFKHKFSSQIVDLGMLCTCVVAMLICCSITTAQGKKETS